MYKNQIQLLEALVKNNLLSQQAVFDLKTKSEATKKSPEELILAEKKVNEEKTPARNNNLSSFLSRNKSIKYKQTVWKNKA